MMMTVLEVLVEDDAYALVHYVCFSHLKKLYLLEFEQQKTVLAFC